MSTTPFPPAAPLSPQLWIPVRQRDATREAAVIICQCKGKPVSRDLLPTAPPPVAACGEVRMTRGERMGALGCMCRAMVMHGLAHGAGVPGAFSAADAQKAMASIMRRHAARAFHPCHPFPFSSDPSLSSPDIVLSPDRLTVSRRTFYDVAWARSERGVGAGCGVVRWAVQLSQGSGGGVFSVGVASEAFSEWTEYWLHQSWYFRDNSMFADVHRQRDSSDSGEWFDPLSFAAGDVVTVELERAPDVDGVLRVRVAGKPPRELRGLPRHGMLYPIVGLWNNVQSYSMIALP